MFSYRRSNRQRRTGVRRWENRLGLSLDHRARGCVALELNSDDWAPKVQSKCNRQSNETFHQQSKKAPVVMFSVLSIARGTDTLRSADAFDRSIVDSGQKTSAEISRDSSVPGRRALERSKNSSSKICRWDECDHDLTSNINRSVGVSRFLSREGRRKALV